MKQSPLRLIKKCSEYIPIEDVSVLPWGIRGIYVLYKKRKILNKFDVVYVGMTTAGETGGVRGRLRKHRLYKEGLWTHFSVYEVWDNIRDDEIKELEGLFRHIYKHDSKANRLNMQRGYKKIREVIHKNYWEWE